MVRRAPVPSSHFRRLRMIVVGLVVIPILLSACAPTDSPAPAEPGRAAVIIVGPDQSSSQTCVTFEAAQVSGKELLELADIPTTLDERNPMGALVCAIDGQGCAYPAEACLCQCQGLGDCAYWASFVRTPPGSWTYAGQGVSMQLLRPGDLYAWVWLPTASSTEALEWLPTGDVEAVCP
jgi:hypothetical protein